MKLKNLVPLVALMLSSCSLGYDNDGPYPYSHVNQPPASTFQSSAPSTQYITPRTKPKPPSKSQVATVQPSGTSTIIVGRGDTVYAISRKYGVLVRSVINSNNLRAPYLLKPGQSLRIPLGSNYVVKRGDTVYGVSRANGIQMSELVRMNALKSPYALSVGQTLKLPGRTATTTRRTQVEIGPPPPITGKGFMWPIKGRILSNFGPKAAGYHNDGINIAAPRGSNVYASESGVVVHADNKLSGYGNLILIKHQNGWVTAYAHNDQMMVKKGDQVRRGQVVAHVGQTGRVDRPQLHFEMRKGSRAVNPTQYLRS